jgi:hypothetical protein
VGLLAAVGGCLVELLGESLVLGSFGVDAERGSGFLERGEAAVGGGDALVGGGAGGVDLVAPVWSVQGQ